MNLRHSIGTMRLLAFLPAFIAKAILIEIPSPNEKARRENRPADLQG